jgi:two-component system chemotaxis sensor kinase CheA
MVQGLRGNPEATFDGTALMQELGGWLSGRVAEEAPAAPLPEDDRFAELAAVTQESVAACPEPDPTPARTAPGPAPAADESIRVSLGRLEKLINYVGEMVILQTVLREQAGAAAGGGALLLRRTVNQLGKVTKEVQDISMSLRMVPLKQTFQKMQRIVRDTAGALGKKVRLEIHGEETELDKTVLEGLGDPLVHIIRNACDHGIEDGAARVAAGKPEEGTVKLSAFHQSNHIVIEIRDDGGGISAPRLVAKAIEKGILKPGTTLPEREALNLIFHPGFSTKAVVTDVSGRGVGMDVVKTNVERLQGVVALETEVGRGTCFQIRMPLTLAIIDGMVVKLGEERFVIPLTHVHESLRPEPGDVHHVTGVGEILKLRDENLPLLRLAKLLGRGDPARPVTDCTVIVVRAAEHAFSVAVDDIVGQHQIVIKSLGAEMRHLRGFSGSAILGDGRPALILELPDLVQRPKLRAPEARAS